MKTIVDAYVNQLKNELIEGRKAEIPCIGQIVPTYRKVAPTMTKRGYTAKFRVDMDASLKGQLIRKLEAEPEFMKQLDKNK